MPLTSMGKPSRQKIKKEKSALSDTLVQIDFINVYRTFYPKSAAYTFLSSVHGTFSRVDHLLVHRTNLNKFKNEIMSSIFFQSQWYETRNLIKKQSLESFGGLAESRRVSSFQSQSPSS